MVPGRDLSRKPAIRRELVTEDGWREHKRVEQRRELMRLEPRNEGGVVASVGKRSGAGGETEGE